MLVDRSTEPNGYGRLSKVDLSYGGGKKKSLAMHAGCWRGGGGV